VTSTCDLVDCAVHLAEVAPAQHFVNVEHVVLDLFVVVSCEVPSLIPTVADNVV
jgi:hypothetical protein